VPSRLPRQVEATGEPWRRRLASAALAVAPLAIFWLLHDAAPAPSADGIP
jgi:hypothetical protein